MNKYIIALLLFLLAIILILITIAIAYQPLEYLSEAEVKSELNI